MKGTHTFTPQWSHSTALAGTGAGDPVFTEQRTPVLEWPIYARLGKIHASEAAGWGREDKPIHCVAEPLYFVSKMENIHYFLWLLGFPYLLLVCDHSGEGKREKTTSSLIWNLKYEYVRFTLLHLSPCSFSKHRAVECPA